MKLVFSIFKKGKEVIDFHSNQITEVNERCVRLRSGFDIIFLEYK